MDAASDRRMDSGERDHFIPVRKSDLIRALVDQESSGGEEQREKFRQLARLLGAIYHYEYFDQLERLRDDYFYFNPALNSHLGFDAATIENAYQDLIAAFTQVLKGANFIEVAHEEIERAHREQAEVRVKLETSVEDYREIRFFRRGHRRDKIEISEWFGWRKRKFDAEIYDDVVMLVTIKNHDESAASGKKKRSAKRKVRPGAVLIKYFHNIASADLNALFPDARVVMGIRDQLWLGVPALLGGIPILLKLASTITVLVVVAGFYLGYSSAVRDDDLTGAIAAVSGLAALGGFIVTQWAKFHRRALMYQKVLTDNIYYRNVNNNAGIFDYIIGAAEDQECKEAFLTYHFLLTSHDAMTEDVLDRRIESWLKQAFKIDIDFECDDALAKLDRAGLLRRDGERIAAIPLDAALVRLDREWDNFFPYAGAAG